MKPVVAVTVTVAGFLVTVTGIVLWFGVPVALTVAGVAIAAYGLLMPLKQD